MSRSPSDINRNKIYPSRPVTSDGPMVSFSDSQAEGRRSNHVVDIVDFLF